MNQSPEEKENGLVLIGRLYMSVDTPEAELYVHVLQGNTVTAYMFKDPTYFWKLVLARCSKSCAVEVEDEHL